MKARFIEFNEDGKATRKDILCEVYFPWASLPPAICVEMPSDEKKGIHREVVIPAEEIMLKMFRDLIKAAKKRSRED